MSTDAAGRRAQRERSRGLVYRRAVGAVLLTLALVCAGLGVWSSVQGPRLRSVQTDPTTLATAAHPQVVLSADQPLAGDASVSVEPDSAVTASVDGAQITLRFAAPLDYATPYRITAEVVSAENGRPSTLTTTVATPDASIYLLERTAAGGGQDELIRTSLKGVDPPVPVFSAARITGYVSLGAPVAVLSSDGATDSLQVIDGSTSEAVPLETGVHTELRRSDLGGLGWLQKTGSRADGSVYESNLFITDQVGSETPHEITGFSGAPISIADWRFIPGTDSVVAQDFDQQLYVIDTRSAKDPVPLGRFGAIAGFLPDSTSVMLTSGGAAMTAIDLSTGDQRQFTPPSAPPPTGQYQGVSVVRDESTAFTQWNAADAGPVGGQRSSTIVLVDGTGVHPVVPATPDGSWVDRYCLSPNGRYLSVQLVGADGRVVGSGLPTIFSDTRVEFVDVTTGQVLRTVPDAADYDWCA